MPVCAELYLLALWQIHGVFHLPLASLLDLVARVFYASRIKKNPIKVNWMK
jgi:hypothetical protein